MAISRYTLARLPFVRLKSPVTYNAGLLDKQLINAEQALSQVEFPTVTSDYTLQAKDLVVFCDATAGSFSITIPTADRMAGSPFTFRQIDSSGNTVTLLATIDGTVNLVLSSGVRIMSNGTAWWTLP